MSIYVKDAAGNRTKIAGAGLPGPAGKSAYQYAVEGGFTGTEDEFKALMGVRSNPNLLDNADFRDTINQRGQNVYASGIYSIDRWAIGYGTITLHSGYIELTGNSGYGLYQSIENFDSYVGVPLTLSVLTQQGLTYGTSTNHTANNDIQFNLALNDGNIDLNWFKGTIRIFGHPNQESKFIAAKLELGPVQTLAHKEGDTWVLNDPPPNKALELAKCQRYYEQTALPAGNTLLRIHNHFDVPHSLAELNARIDFLTEKRIAPVVLIEYDINDGEAQTMFAQYCDLYGFTDNTLQIPANSWIDINSYSANADI